MYTNDGAPLPFVVENSHLEGSSTIAVQQVGPDSNQGRLEGKDSILITVFNSG